MPYYHDERARAVYAEPEHPEVITKRETVTKRRKHPKRLGCKVWVTVEVTRADNWIKPDTNQWAHPVQIIRSENYDDRDDDARAVGFFRSRHMGGWGSVIDAETYARLKAEYEAAAKGNKPPSGR